MINILEIEPVLTVFPYALLYYALLLVSSGLALFSLRGGWSENSRSQLRTALVVIFVSQLVLLTFNLITYQGYPLARDLFPIAHRILNLVSLVWLIWAFFRLQDANIPGWLPAAFTAIFVGIGILFSFWWLPTAQPQNFNRSWMDYTLVAMTLILLIFAGVAYYIRSRRGILEAWLILFIVAAGFILNLVLPSSGNLPGAVMLSQLLYYPLLLNLANRSSEMVEPVTVSTEPECQLRANVINAFLDVSLQPNQNQLEKALTHSLSLYLMADLLGLVRYESAIMRFSLDNTYDLIREDHLGQIELSTDRLPYLFQRFDSGEAFFSNRDSDLLAEKQYLMQVSGYNQIGTLLLFPLKTLNDQTRWAILGLNPYTQRKWNQEDIRRLDRLQENLARVLESANRLEHNSKLIETLQAQLVQKEQELTTLNQEHSDIQSELQTATADLVQTQQAWTEEVILWVERQKSLENELELLQQTLEENQKSMAEVDELRLQKDQLEETIARNSEQVAQLKTTMAQANQLIQKLTASETPDEDEPE